MSTFAFPTRPSRLSPHIRLSPIASKWLSKKGNSNNGILTGYDVAKVITITDGRTILYEELKGQKGVVTLQNVERGDRLLHWTGTYVSQWEWKSIPEHHHHYIMRIDGSPKWFIVPSYNGLAEFINDGKRDGKKSANNACFVEEEINGFPVVSVIATRKIKKGKQIFANYGNKYWDHYDK